MRFAADPAGQRPSGDLGRFGLGLKTASLSQARKLTVLSRGPAGNLAVMTWDLDHIRRNREWRVINHADPEALEIAADLDFAHQGTAVLWRNIDRLGDGPELVRNVAEAGKRLSLLFHRFMTSGRLCVSVGGRRLRPMDPYLLRNPLTQDRGSETLEWDGHRITVNPVVLPHPGRLSKDESLLASGPGGLLGLQGFYVYRGDRLVVAGGWLGLSGMHKTAHTRLARIRVEIPPGADLAWMVDVRKSTVRPPVPLTGRLEAIAQDARARSQRVFTHRGTPAPSTGKDRDVVPVWRQVRRLGRNEYVLSRDHPLIAGALSGGSGPAIEGILKMIETTLPIDLIAPQPAVPPEDVNADVPGVEDVMQTFKEMLAMLPEDPDRRADLAESLANAEPFNRFPGLIREIIHSDTSGEL
jgi:hypothetical protein